MPIRVTLEKCGFQGQIVPYTVALQFFESKVSLKPFMFFSSSKDRLFGAAVKGWLLLHW